MLGFLSRKHQGAGSSLSFVAGLQRLTIQQARQISLSLKSTSLAIFIVLLSRSSDVGFLQAISLLFMVWARSQRTIQLASSFLWETPASRAALVVVKLWPPLTVAFVFFVWVNWFGWSQEQQVVRFFGCWHCMRSATTSCLSVGFIVWCQVALQTMLGPGLFLG